MISRVGTWMQRIGVILVVYTMTNSILMVGPATFAELFPFFYLVASRMHCCRQA
ncbi:MAG: hypothetical protein QM610_04420 [Chitinophagaceae bacterium]